MSDLRVLSRAFLSDFIDAYRQNTCLWKIKSKEYSDRNKKNAAYDLLIEKLKQVDPESSRDKVIKKINSLRTCFRKELKKVRDSKRSGATVDKIYRPTLWYFEELLFLADQETLRPSGGTSSKSAHEEVSLLNQNDDDIDIDVHEVASPSVPSPASSSSRHTKKPKIDPADEVLNIVAKHLKSQNEEKYATFGRFIAQELAGLDEDMAKYCKKIINDAIFEAHMGTLSRKSIIVTQTLPPRSLMQPMPHHSVVCTQTGDEMNNLDSNSRAYLRGVTEEYLSKFQDSSNAASEETNEDDPLSENPHQSDGDLETECSDFVMQDSKHEIMLEEPVTKVEPSVDPSDTASGIDIVKSDPDFEFSPMLKERDLEQKEVSEQAYSVKKERDNFDIFGELVAHKLRHLQTDYARSTVEHLISNILYEASMGKYDFPESDASSSVSSQVTSSFVSNL